MAVELLEDVGRWLGIGLANLAAALDPGTFVIGGGVCDAGELLLAPAREAFRRTLTGRGFRPEARVVRAVLGPEAGMVGAADLAREESTWLRRVRVKTTAVTAKTAARATRTERAAARSERVARRASMLGGSRRSAFRAEEDEDLHIDGPPVREAADETVQPAVDPLPTEPGQSSSRPAGSEA